MGNNEQPNSNKTLSDPQPFLNNTNLINKAKNNNIIAVAELISNEGKNCNKTNDFDDRHHNADLHVINTSKTFINSENLNNKALTLQEKATDNDHVYSIPDRITRRRHFRPNQTDFSARKKESLRYRVHHGQKVKRNSSHREQVNNTNPNKLNKEFFVSYSNGGETHFVDQRKDRKTK